MASDFQPSLAADPESGIFGLDDSAAEAKVHVLGVPFDATTSFRRGAAAGPEAILRASHQVELLDLITGKPYEAGIYMHPIDDQVRAWNDEARRSADPVIEAGGAERDPNLREYTEKVDGIQEQLNRWVQERVEASLKEGKLCAVVGGDHSVPLGAIQAHARQHPGMGILHFDAHADLRVGFEGFRYSHASIFDNVLKSCGQLGPLVQVGLRDVCEEELERIHESRRIHALFDHEWARLKLSREPLINHILRTLEPLPEEVYVSLDIDGLDPSLCPNTGTPVPGGLTWHETMLWLEALVDSGRRIVGFDLCEVAPGISANQAVQGDEPSLGEGWDEIVGARLLYRLIGFALR